MMACHQGLGVVVYIKQRIMEQSTKSVYIHANLQNAKFQNKKHKLVIYPIWKQFFTTLVRN